jgi:hypothetical protein
MSEKVWAYSTSSGWQRAEDPANLSDDEDYEKSMRKAKYSCVTRWPHNSAAIFLEMYEHDEDEKWVLNLCTPCRWHSVAIEDLPSLIDLLGKLLPIAQSAEHLDALGEKHDEAMREAKRKNRKE